MEIRIFSDVLCTWCYGEEKVLRAIDYIYGGAIKFKNIMGGMIADYHDILPMNMKDKDSNEEANKILRTIWVSGSTIHKMPVMKDEPKLLSREKPSGYYFDVLFVAARLTDEKKANDFLREFRFATILYGKNTLDERVAASIAKSVGIDEDEYLGNIELAKEVFLEDRVWAFDLRMTTFPNFMYIDDNRKEYVLKGYKNFKQLSEFIDRFGTFEKKKIFLNEDEVLNFIKHYKKVFLPELVEVFENEEEIKLILENLQKRDVIQINPVGTGEEILLK